MSPYALTDAVASPTIGTVSEAVIVAPNPANCCPKLPIRSIDERIRCDEDSTSLSASVNPDLKPVGSKPKLIDKSLVLSAIF